VDRLGQHDLARVEAGDLGGKAVAVGLAEEKAPGRDVDGGKAVGGSAVGEPPPRHRHQEVGAGGIEEVVLGDGAGRHEPHHVAAYDRLVAALARLGRVLALLAYGHAMAEGDQALEIVVGALDRHAAHGDVGALVLAALGQNDAERPAGGLRVFQEQFVEIPHPVEQEAVRIGGLDLQVLRHHGRDASDFLGRFRRSTIVGSGLVPARRAMRREIGLGPLFGSRREIGGGVVLGEVAGAGSHRSDHSKARPGFHPARRSVVTQPWTTCP
jgi:hypothetical protein